MAPQDDLSPPGSSTYSSNTMYVGDGTWDATRNDFLLPNLVGLNFATMRYNGMGNRFASLPQYHQIIKGHGVVAVITFLFIVPFAILIGRYSRSPNALRTHIYLQILTVALSTVVFTLGWFAVGPERSLTNPHHGIGTAIYVLILVQAIGGWWNYRRKKKHMHRKPTIKMVLHWWIGRAIALLGFAQVALGLTLYGSPKFTFVLYALWMSFLLLLFFILAYRSIGDTGGIIVRDGSISHGGTVIEDKKPSRFGGLLGPLAAGAGAAALLGSRRNRSRSRSRRDEVIPSRRGSGSYIEDEKYEESRKKKSGGTFDTLLKGAAVLGAAGLAKSWWDNRQRKKEEEYDSVDPDTPSRRHRRHDSVSEESVEVHRMEEGRRGDRPILPGPGNPALAAAALSAAEPRTKRPRTPRRHSYDSEDSSFDSAMSPSRRPRSSHGLEKGVLAGLGLGWFAKKMKDRRDRKELDRLDREEADRIERERLAREGATPSRLTGDGYPASPRRKLRRPPPSGSSNLSSVIDDPHGIRPGAIPPIPAAMAAGGLAGAAASQMRSSRHTVTEPVAMPPAPPDPQGILHQEESGSEAYNSAGGHVHRRHSSRRRRDGEEAAAVAAAGAAALAAEEEERRRRSRSRGGDRRADVNSPPVSVKVKVHDDANRHVTLRRLTEQEAAAEREARKSDRRRRRADSVSSLSASDTATSRRRFRRDEREAERRAESSVPPPPPPAMAPLSPPNPAFAGGRRPKDSAYYSGRPGEASGSGGAGPAQGSGVGSPESHGTWSGMSPSGSEAVDERRRRRRAERNRGNQPGTVDFT
ncbi:hypothetical protein L207DRAFT_589012 [Hyaloscypha variabilis F]|uniref:Cytochrome b561 domain-containing protein n=1 Tax=Hyaloscypha variabilis (strain UAMH 11265 / GT02V1 / F) TaxID=1149755 RepID=A0A2J6R7B9_HYAVF|nr:hypothetical protein L207DRAFT_589012 [Hyaloscypha variabilis F]